MSRVARLGAFIFGALLILTFVVFRIGDKDFLFSSTYHLQAPFDNVAGLGNGSEVRLGGVRVGTVEMIQMPQTAGGRVVVVMNLESSTRKLIRKDSVVAIQTEGLLGSKYVTISSGSPNAAEVQEGDTLQSQPPLDFSDLLKKADTLLVSTQDVLNNVEAASADMKSITGKIDRGEGTAGALINNREIYNQARAAVTDTRKTAEQARVGATAFQENMQALKNNWFFRGFFKNRGYQDPAELTKHAVKELPQQPVLETFAFPAKDLFDKPDNAKLKNEKRLNGVGNFLEKTPYELVVVTASVGMKGETGSNLVLTQARATVIREYLVEHFKIDDTRVKTLGRGEDEQIREDASGIEIIVYARGAPDTEGQSRKKVSSIQPEGNEHPLIRESVGEASE